VCIEHSKVFRRGLEMLGISSSVPVHSANASARAEDATRGFNIRAGTTST
jgi:hypothetical protein